MIWLRMLTGSTTHINSLCHCDKQYENKIASVDLVDCNCGVLCSELARLLCVVTIATSLLMLLCIYVRRPVLEDNIESTLPLLQFCWHHDVDILRLGRERWQFDLSTTLPACCCISKALLRIQISTTQHSFIAPEWAHIMPYRKL